MVEIDQKVTGAALASVGRGSLFAALLSGTALAGAASSHAQENGPTTYLDKIIITATGSEQTVKDAPATVTIIDGEEINSKPYASLADVLRDVPGVTVGGNSQRSGGRQITIRGLSDSYVLLMIDGRPIGNSGEATYDGFGVGVPQSYLPPPAAIERIEVIRGPMSSLYGSSAMGGVINVITKPVSPVWTGTITGGTTIHENDGDGDSYEGRFYTSGPLIADRLGLTLYGSLHEHYDRVLAPAGPIPSSLQDVGRNSLGGKLDWQITDNQKAALEISRNVHNSENDGTFGTSDTTHMNYSLTHGLNWGDGYETNSFITYENTDFERQAGAFPGRPGPLPAPSESGYSMLNFNSKTNLTLGQHDLTVGGDYRWEETRHTGSRFPGIDPVMDRWHAAAFAEDNWRVLENFTVTLGARYDHNERYGAQFTPRLYGVWDVSPSLVLKGGMSGGYKVPQLKQADSSIFEPSNPVTPGWIRGNDDLLPEESTNYEIGFVWASELGFQFGVTGYHTRFTNKIDSERICSDFTGLTCDGRAFIDRYINRDSAELSGVELTLDVPIQTFDLSFNYTYAHSRITSGAGDGDRFNNLPEHVVNLGANWHATEALDVWGNVQYRSESFDAGSALVEDHVLFDVGMNYKFNDHATAHLAVYNVGDVQFDNDYIDGRRIYLGMTATF